ncbi:MAG: hypothetical protein H8D45_23745 [Bacteroidetes bacterium]|nr:hypothetical protein [Bacteroidota bacterium]
MRDYNIDNKPEPLEFLFTKYKVSFSNIHKVVTGAKYTALLLKNGNIGVCANFGNRIEDNPGKYSKLDLKNISHRIFLTAYFNALLNYTNDSKKSGDIFDIVDFRKYKNIVMIGLFKPIVRKFEEENISLSVFDYLKDDSVLISGSKKSDYLKKSDAVILSSTTIFNNTFKEIITNSKERCDIFLLGPSSIISREIFDYWDVKIIFGTVFEKNDERILDIIKNGGGTKYFQPYGRKVYLENVSDG